MKRAFLLILLLIVIVPWQVHAASRYTLLETCRSQYLNKPGIGVYKNAVCTTEFSF